MCDINSTSFYPEPSLGQKLPFIDVKRQIRGRMITVDFGSLQRRTKRYWRKTKWCSVFVLFTLANLLITICISAVWSSQEPQVFAKLSVNTCVMLACSFLVIKQHLDANKPIRSEQLAFEGLMADFKGVEASNDRLRMELSESQLKCIDLQTKLDAATLDLEKARRENDGFREELKGAKASSDRLKGSLKRSLESRRELQKKLRATERNADNALYARNTARDIAKGVISERNGLRTERDKLLDEVDNLKKKFIKVKTSSEWFQFKCWCANNRINYAKMEITELEHQIADLKCIIGILNNAIGLLRQKTHGDE
mgnify:CR=1 FL=1